MMAATDLRERVGSVAQVARLDRFAREEGPGRGDRVIRVVSGGGLAFEVLPDRGMDIGHAEWHGTPLAWISESGWPSGETATDGIDWLRSFGGGLLVTCGLDSFGPPSTDGGRTYGLHGLISSQRAEITAADLSETAITLAGRVRQGGLFHEVLRLDRTITVPLLGHHIDIVDVVTNDGVEPEGHMLLWHCNLGWPLLDDGAYVERPGSVTRPRDAEAEKGIDDWANVHGPRDDYPEQVFIHDAPSAASARLVNPARNLAVTLTWDGDKMPAMFQWKMLRRRHYVMGLEPANTPAIMGRADARATGQLPILQPGESCRYRLRICLDMLG